ncbi:MAG: AtpZ/AtpI family protein [Sporomusa sp.]
MSDKHQGIWSALSLAGSIGLSWAATIAVGLFLGRWADKYLGLFPWLTVAGIVLGMVTGLWATYKKIVK